MIRGFDECAGWLQWGMTNCAEWLAWRCDFSMNTALPAAWHAFSTNLDILLIEQDSMPAASVRYTPILAAQLLGLTQF
jgi:hypothetical protein